MHEFKDSNKKVFLMSLPIFVELLLQLLVGNIDQVMLSHISQSDVAAIGNANQITNIIVIAMELLSSAALILNSQYLGANDTKRTYAVCHVVIIVVGIFALCAGAMCVLLPRTIFSLMNVPSDVIGGSVKYLSIIGVFFIVQGIYVSLAAILRSYGCVKEVMFISLIMNVINICGNTILINGLFFFPKLGIAGAAISTNISKFIGMVIMYRIFRKSTGIKFSLRYIKPFPFDTLKILLKIGIPTGAEAFSYNLSQIAILSFINIFGTNVIATKVYSSMFANIAYLYSMAIAQSAQINIGYLVGSKNLERIPHRVYLTSVICIAVSVSVTIFIFINSRFIYSIFTSEQEILLLGHAIMFIEIFLEIGRSINIVMTKCLVAINDVYFPVIIGILSQWTVGVVFGYLIGVHFAFGLVGIWICMACDEALRGILFLIRFKLGIWRKKVYGSLSEQV